MNAIHDRYATGRGKQTCVVPHELTVHIHSSDVPTMEIVDLPGIRETPEDMREATRQLAKEYAQQPTNIVLCVVPAQQQRLVSSQAVGIVEQIGQTAVKRTMSVLTKCDKVSVTRTRDMSLLTDRIAGRSRECGIVRLIGVINRDVEDEEQEEQQINTGSEIDRMLRYVGWELCF